MQNMFIYTYIAILCLDKNYISKYLQMCVKAGFSQIQSHEQMHAWAHMYAHIPVHGQIKENARCVLTSYPPVVFGYYNAKATQ